MEDVFRIANGAPVPATFSDREMARRLDRLRQEMARRNLDVALFTSYHNVNYFSDFLYCSFGRPYALIVSADSVTSVSANIDGGQPGRRTAGDNIVYTDWRRDNFLRALQTLIQDGRRIGVEHDHLTLETDLKLRAALPNSAFVDMSAVAMAMRMVKSPEEIALIRQGARIANVGGAACIDAIAEGVPEYEVALASTGAMVREIARTYPAAELRDTWTWFQSGLNTDGAHNPVTSRRIARGDILSLNCFPMIAGYYTALERTLFLERATPRQLKVWEVNCEVHRHGMKLIRPGMRCCDIAAELNEIYRAEDLLQYRTFGYGHSFGVLCHYYGREAGLELREDVETELGPGMVVSMEPMLMIPEGLEGAGGYREHDILVVTEDGAENITGFPFGPEHHILPA